MNMRIPRSAGGATNACLYVPVLLLLLAVAPCVFAMDPVLNRWTDIPVQGGVSPCATPQKIYYVGADPAAAGPGHWVVLCSDRIAIVEMVGDTPTITHSISSMLNPELSYMSPDKHLFWTDMTTNFASNGGEIHHCSVAAPGDLTTGNVRSLESDESTNDSGIPRTFLVDTVNNFLYYQNSKTCGITCVSNLAQYDFLRFNLPADWRTTNPAVSVGNDMNRLCGSEYALPFTASSADGSRHYFMCPNLRLITIDGSGVATSTDNFAVSDPLTMDVADGNFLLGTQLGADSLGLTYTDVDKAVTNFLLADDTDVSQFVTWWFNDHSGVLSQGSVTGVPPTNDYCLDVGNTCTVESSIQMGGIWRHDDGNARGLLLRGDGNDLAGITFVAVDCTQYTSCSACRSADVSYCGWCMQTATCTMVDSCPMRSSWINGAWNGALQCPSMVALSPNTINKQGGGPPMVVIGADFYGTDPPLDAAELRCHWNWGTFGTAQEVALLTSDANRITCSSRAHPNGGDDFDLDWPKTGVLSLTYKGVVFSDEALNITYTNCPSTCTECATAPGCGWCSGLSVCTAEPLCVGDTQLPWLEVSCPSLVDATPSEAEVTSGRTLVQVSTSTSVPLGDTTAWECQWNMPNGLIQTTPAVRSGTTTVDCRTPEASPALAGEAFVTLRYNGFEYAPSDPMGAGFDFYNCTPSDASTSCQSCIDGTRDCYFCVLDQTCDPPQRFSLSPSNPVPVCSVGSANSQCPVLLGVNPPEGGRFGTTDVVVTVTEVPQGATLVYECAFAFDSALANDTTVPAQVLSSTTVACTPPAVGAEIVSNLTLLLNGAPFGGNSLTYSFLSCDSITTCSSCVQTPECRFCASQTCQDATANTTCPVQDVKSVCPMIDTVTPTTLARGTNTPLSVSVNYLPTLNNTFEVRIMQNATMEVDRLACSGSSSTTVSCPPFGSGLATGFYDVQLHLTNLASTLWAQSADVLQVHDCQDQGNCTQCLGSVSGCTWCLTDAACDITNNTCSADATADECPSLTGLSPSFGDKAGGTLIRAIGQHLTSGLACRFRRGGVTQYTPASKLSDQQVTCVSPIIEESTLATRRRMAQFPIAERVDLVYADTNEPYADTAPLTYEFVECSLSVVNETTTTDSCITCLSSALVDPRCGWCPTSFDCVPLGDCEDGDNSVWDASLLSCPAIVEFVPDSGPAAGGTSVNVTGTNFVNVSRVACEFDGATSNATAYMYATGVSGAPMAIGYRCITPPLNVSAIEQDNTRALVRLVRLGVENDTRVAFTAPAQGSFLYRVEEPNNSDSGLSMTTLIGMGVGAFLILALLAILILVLVRRKRGHRPLRKPDFEQLLFPRGSGAVYRVSNRQRQNFTTLRHHLLQPNMAFVDLMIEQKTGANAASLGLGFAYVFTTDRRTVHLLRHLITTEVAIAKAPGTLFRANSIATKCFTAWAQLNLLDYSWYVLARMVNDIADRNRRKEASAAKPSAMSEEPDESVMMADFEVGPTMTEADQQDVVANSYQVLIVLTKLFARLKRSIPQMPMDLRRFLRHVKTEVSARWPDERYKAVGGFLILRFLNPALVSPQSYGLLPEAPGNSTRNNLLTISRVFQNLINETLPGTKQEYLTKFNEFVDDNLYDWHAFVDELTAIAGGEEGWERLDQDLEASVDIPEDHYVDAQVGLHNVCAKKQDAMKAAADRDWEYLQQPLEPIPKRE